MHAALDSDIILGIGTGGRTGRQNLEAMNEVLIHTRHERRRAKVLVKRLIWSAAGSCALGGLFAWSLEDHWLRIERRRMPLPGLGPDLEGATLAHISDLHCCPIVRERYLLHCVNAVNKLNADFVAITGDFITGPQRYAHRVARVLSELKCNIAALACLGNHDYGIFHPRGLGGRRGLAEYVADELMHRDIFVMRNEARVFRVGNSGIQFVGLEDYWSGQYNPHLAFEMTHSRVPTIALCHNPDAALQVAHFGAAWVLAGHTHGQKTPDTRFHDLILPTNHKQFAAGHYALGNDRHLYVNRGLGYARRMNLNSRPEITLFTLTSQTPVAGRRGAGQA